MQDEPPAGSPGRPEGRVYVLRIWEERSARSVGWRASVREGTRGQRSYFASIDDCLEYLYTEFLRR